MEAIEILFLIVSVFFIILGISIKHLKMYYLVAGYNTLPEKEKKEYDIEKFALLLRNVFVIIGLIILGSVLITLKIKNEFLIPTVTFISIVIGVVYLLIQGTKFRNKKEE